MVHYMFVTLLTSYVASVYLNVNNVLLVFSVTPFKIDQNKNQNRSKDKVQNLRNERR